MLSCQNDQKWPKMLVSTWIWTRVLPGRKKSENFLTKATTEPRRNCISCEQNIVAKLVNSNLCLIDMEHDLNLTLEMYKSAFSDKQIIEIKKKMHIDPIFTYSDSEIALKVCRNKQRFKLNRSPLCYTIKWLHFFRFKLIFLPI